ncbi:MAG: DNA cytosine methyltransferase [archaeon]
MKNKVGNGTKDSVSRYSKLKERFDKDPKNQGYIEIDTQCLTADEKFNFVDLFAGCGGISCGMEDAGFDGIMTSEIVPCAVQTLRKNFPNTYHHEGDIQDLNELELDKIIGNKKIDMICGGPPCQGFSVAGLRNPHDPRNKLFNEFVRVVKHLKPEFLVMENVPGILTMGGGEVYREIIRQFEELGYKVNVRILEAATFGAPQLRARAVFIGNRLGLPNPYPKKIFNKDNYRTIKQAIDDLKDLPRNASTNHEWTAHKPEFEKRISKVKYGESLYPTFRDAYKRQYPNSPSMTAKENHGGTHIHYEKNRVLSARELARLQTFPDNFFFEGGMKKAYWQIGNAVPCIMAKHIGLAIAEGLKKAKGSSISFDEAVKKANEQKKVNEFS